MSRRTSKQRKAARRRSEWVTKPVRDILAFWRSELIRIGVKQELWAFERALMADRVYPHGPVLSIANERRGPKNSVPILPSGYEPTNE